MLCSVLSIDSQIWIKLDCILLYSCKRINRFDHLFKQDPHPILIVESDEFDLANLYRLTVKAEALPFQLVKVAP